VTKVLVRSRQVFMAACCLAATVAVAQPNVSSHCPQTTAELYARIRSVGLDPSRVYRVRDASLERPNLSLTFEDGTLIFTEDICGRITGAFFVGDGEVLLQPPNRVERASLALFTGMAILEEPFSSAYLRFNDDTAEVLQPFLTATSWTNESFKEWDDASRSLADYDTLRLFMDFSHFLPGTTANATPQKFPEMLHLHLVGRTLGSFEVSWDVESPEPLVIGQLRAKDNLGYFDIWTAFAPALAAGQEAAPARSDVTIAGYRIEASVEPPVQLQAVTEADLRVRKGGERALLFELSRYLKVSAVESNDHAVNFIQNPAMEGTQLDRKGNDLVAVVFPAELGSGQELKLRFRYAGDVLSDAGSGLLYVGARGSWYPNLGLNPASFDMEFRYPAAWTLVATGKRSGKAEGAATAAPAASGEKTTRWVTERPIAVAGFNLGKYVRAEAKAGNIVVEAYGTKGVEKTFPKAPAELVETVPELAPGAGLPSRRVPIVIAPPPPSPAHDLEGVAERAARAVGVFSQWFGPYPYSSLAITQMPGDLSQGWPGLVFLASLAFLSSQEQLDLNLAPVTRVLDSQVLVHETAHQWWGDLVMWKGYQDQWISEGLANYAALLLLEQGNPGQFRRVMTKYRNDLLTKNKDGEWIRDAGPVTLGTRLISSHFPNGYDEISYERGTWLFHMLRTMLRDAEGASSSRRGKANREEPFFRALRKVRERYAGKAISTQELVEVFEEELPRPLWYENRHKLDWFVKGWIEGTAIPQLEARGVRIADKGGAATVSGVIVQKDAPEDLVTAVPVYGETASKSLIYLGEVFADGPETPLHLSAPAEVRKIVIDPEQTILRQ